MKRYPPFEPREYVDWQPDPDAMADYRQRFVDNPGLRYALESLGSQGLGRIYREPSRRELQRTDQGPGAPSSGRGRISHPRYRTGRR